MSKQLTMSDIARMAGVSIATVSRVLSNHPMVREETRKRVLALVKEHRYEPSYVARNLSTRRTHTIGVVVDDISNPFFMELAKGIESVLQKNRYTMLLTSSSWDTDKEAELIRTLLRNRVDGVLITPVHPESESTEIMRRNGVPFVIMNCRSDHDSASYVSTDNLEGGRVAAELMLRTSPAHFLCLSGIPHQSTNERAEGFIQEIKNHGRSEDLAVYEEVRTFEDGYNIVPSLIARNRVDVVSTGIFTSNDFVAMGILDGLIEHKIPVPSQVSVIGYDDIAFAERYRIPLTTVVQAKQSMGQLAADELMELIQDRNHTPARLLLKPRLIVRDSCPTAQTHPPRSVVQ
ncbi:MAG: LacI family transcriptional regulator [Spirochaeta sp.]|nr:LacI family transcriptional regulator [Spirochaeta sp.]